jgi:hypothetical protein
MYECACERERVYAYECVRVCCRRLMTISHELSNSKYVVCMNVYVYLNLHVCDIYIYIYIHILWHILMH